MHICSFRLVSLTNHYFDVGFDLISAKAFAFQNPLFFQLVKHSKIHIIYMVCGMMHYAHNELNSMRLVSVGVAMAFVLFRIQKPGNRMTKRLQNELQWFEFYTTS